MPIFGEYKPNHQIAQSHHIIVAIDGYSSCGKSTLACELAGALGYTYIDTGAMYRAATLYFLEQKVINEGKFSAEKVANELANINLNFSEGIPLGVGSAIFLNGRNVSNEIRSMEVANWVSKISANAELRAKMVGLQREIGKPGGVVMDGRDIGTVVFPQAELKIFMTASLEVRTQRRKLELEAKGVKVTDEEVRQNLRLRDEEDTKRKESPLRQAPDAIVLDNSHINREQQLAMALQWATSIINN